MRSFPRLRSSPAEWAIKNGGEGVWTVPDDSLSLSLSLETLSSGKWSEARNECANGRTCKKEELARFENRMRLTVKKTATKQRRW